MEAGLKKNRESRAHLILVNLNILNALCNQFHFYADRNKFGAENTRIFLNSLKTKYEEKYI